MNLLEYSRKVVEVELTWISRHSGGSPPWWRKVVLRLKWQIRNLGYKVIRGHRRRQERMMVTQLESG